MKPINIMMLGGKRCGKTSVLAAMQSNFEEVMSKSDLNIIINDYTTLDVLEAKFREAEDFFRERNKKKRTFTPDISPTLDISTYSFSIGTKGKKGELVLNFTDYPGEFISDPAHRETILQHIKNSRILVIAIDSPHMMEEEQKFDDIRNLEKRITEMIKLAEFADPEKGPGMVLFVPLKCERYRDDDRMGEVCAQVKTSYKQLINYLRSTNMNITIAITPIFTFGGAAFSRFERDENGEIKINPQINYPENAIYYFPDMTKDKPEPEYCDQPLLYILSFVITQVAEMKAQRNILDTIWEGFKDWYYNFPSLEEYEAQLQNINSKVKKKDDGYYFYK